MSIWLVVRQTEQTGQTGRGSPGSCTRTGGFGGSVPSLLPSLCGRGRRCALKRRRGVRGGNGDEGEEGEEVEGKES